MTEPTRPAVVVISHTTWISRFGGDPDVVGRTVSINGRPFIIVGVIPGTFRGVDMPNVLPTPFWVPLSNAAAVGLDLHSLRHGQRDASREGPPQTGTHRD